MSSSILYEKLCEQCGKLYGPGTRKPQAFARSRFCSLECCGLSQRHSDVQKLASQIQVNPDTGCHMWLGHRIGRGYGRTRFNGKKVLVHRLMWEQFRGPIPEDLQIDHICGVKLCCNVEHLRLVTNRENTIAPTCNNMAARNYRRTICPKCGGPYSQLANGVRYCKPCRHEASMNYQRWRRAEKKAGKSGMKRDTGET